MEDEEEEADFPRTKRPKRGRTCITHLWSNVHDHLVELFVIRRESLVLLLQGQELLRLDARIVFARPKLLRLDARYWLGAPNSWDITGHPQILGRSVGEPVHPIFIGSKIILPPSTNSDWNSDWSNDRPHIFPSTDYYRSLENEKRNHHIQFKKIITYKIKWLNEHTMKCWARLSTNCCTPFWRSSLRTCVSTNSSIGLDSRPRGVACKKKN